ncbi:hypothetical protein SRB5_67960 [Streptomyces sp. RB5]|uniref:ABC transporter n=1 Tax=Streptomyces smaragdinus TaxID=2585196 RepID=A0A7K0CVB5_9ACTN|nr:ABC transporter permease [Streptomyces smaragdinus]MQY16594.1 hypothetical protein [Streptomyces smaragdinus]
MLRTALRNLTAHKARLLMTALAILLGVAFVAGTLVFTETISDAYTKSAEQGYDHMDVQLSPDNKEGEGHPGAAPKLTQHTLDAAEQLPGAKSAVGVVGGFTALADKDGDLVGGGWATTGANYYGETDPRYPLQDGKAPTSQGEVAIDAKTATRTGYHIGDTVRLSVNGPIREEKVTGIFTTDDGNVAAGGSLVLFDTATAQQLFTAEGEFSSIEITAKGGVDQAELKQQAERILPEEAKAVTAHKLASDQAAMVQTQMDGLRTGMLAFAGISLFVGVFLIANTFTMLVAQRAKELALLRAIGASRRQVTRSVLIEAFAVGTLAGLAGLAAGIGIGAGLRSLLGGTGVTVPDGALVVSPATVLVSLAVGIVVTVLAAWLPARRAAKIPPVAAMSALHAAPTVRGLVVRNTIGSILAGAGAALVVVATGQDDGKGLLSLGAGLLLIGVFVLTPLLSRPLIALAAPVLRLFGVAGRLARQNAVRNPRRTSATASALMIGLTLVTGLTVIGMSMANAIDKMSSNAMTADYQITMGGGIGTLAPEVGEKLAALDEVTASTPLRSAPVRLDGDKRENWVTGLDSASAPKLIALDFTEGSFAGLAGDKAIVDTHTAEREGWRLGDSIALTWRDGTPGKLTISGLYQDNQMISGIMLDNAVLSPHLDHPADMMVFVSVKDGVGQASKDSLEAALGDNPAIRVMDEGDVSDEISGVFTMMLNILYALLGMAVIVAVLGVINTLAMSVFERSQEIGMLRAVGLDRRGVKRMVRLESLTISLFGGVLGIVLGVFLGWAAGELIVNAGVPTYTHVLPWGRLGLFLALAALVGVIAALWPARRAAKLNMLAAIKSQ